MEATISQPEFGRRLRLLREARGLTQAQLAGDGMSKPYVSRLESGTRPPTDRAIAYLAERLGVDVSELKPGGTPTLAEALAMAASTADPARAVEQVKDALDREPGADPTLRWQALWMLADLNTPDHGDLLNCLVALAEEVGQPVLRAQALARLARYLRTTGDAERAYDIAQSALPLMPDVSPADQASILLALVSIETETGRFSAAAQHSGELQDLLPHLPVKLRVETLWTTAVERSYQGHFTESAQALSQAIKLLNSGDDLHTWMRLRLAASRLYLMNPPEGLDSAGLLLGEAEAAVALIGLPRHRSELGSLKARHAFLQGDYETAAALCREVQPHIDDLAFRDRMRHCSLELQLRLLNGDATAATELEQLATQARQSGNFELSSEIWKDLATARASAAKIEHAE
ncbi:MULTISPECIES: helix-turn-helix transcriptional regulator [Kitasatospora]|nr:MULTISPECIES: helix-turn-helix transcriptional regulator [Kitasatospora]